jgi:hypothetical protein
MIACDGVVDDVHSSCVLCCFILIVLLPICTFFFFLWQIWNFTFSQILSLFKIINRIWLLDNNLRYRIRDHFCGLVVGVSGYRSRGLRFDSRRYQIFLEAMGMKRGPLSLMSTAEELLGRNSSGSNLESLEYGTRYPCH